MVFSGNIAVTSIGTDESTVSILSAREDLVKSKWEAVANDMLIQLEC